MSSSTIWPTPARWRSGRTACAGSPPPTDGLWLAYDRLGSETEIYTRTVANREARTVDYHCAWDQGRHLWMIYLMRVVDAQAVFNKPGSVVLWTNCHHPFYDDNPYPETAPPERPVWVGDFWEMFGAGHLLELKNLKAIAEYRHHNGLPITPDWMRMRARGALPTVSLIDVATYLPENRVPAECYTQYSDNDDLRDNPMFRPPDFRHHAADESPTST